MKVPAECPGESSKEERKKLKAERQEHANATPTLDQGLTTTSTAAPSLTRQDTMTSLSSGYAASGARSPSINTINTVNSAEPAKAAAAESKPAAAIPSRRNRVLAPPPTNYVSPPPAVNGSSLKSSENKGKMLYAYQASGDDEITVKEGEDVAIIEPDGKLAPPVDQPLLRKHLG